MKKFIIYFMILTLPLVVGWFSAIWYVKEKVLKRAEEVIAVVEKSQAVLKKSNEIRKENDEISLDSRLETYTELARLYGNCYFCRNSLLELGDTLLADIDKYQSDHTSGFSLRSKKNQSNKFAIDYEKSLNRIMLEIDRDRTTNN